MKQTLRSLFFVTALGTLIIASSCKKDDPVVPPIVVTNTITDKVVADASFTLLEQAVIKADLAGTLSSAGPFTVFAPDDAAFNAATFNAAFIASASTTPAALKTILLYHTIPAKILANAVPAGPNAKVITASGDSVFVTSNASGVFVNGVKVTAADIAADNGVIHKVGRVIKPATGNIVTTAAASGLDSLVKAVTRATNAPGGDPTLANTLSTATLTVFAPTNAAFTQVLGALTLTDINQIPIATLLAVLRLHVVSPSVNNGRAFSSALANGSLPMIVASTSTTVAVSASGATIKGNGNATAANITATDIMCRNGVVHLIDRVLLP
jgi:uncharacterized surface protein with fasciclin (FAS1) repeats